ncbi:MAG: trypsin-like peptidase domain-containing protein [Amoebophilaceae bacterium]|nr:trypsin-like peptidase domain-containing protein [Amoebophilaceae bacterium]
MYTNDTPRHTATGNKKAYILSTAILLAAALSFLHKEQLSKETPSTGKVHLVSGSTKPLVETPTSSDPVHPLTDFKPPLKEQAVAPEDQPRRAPNLPDFTYAARIATPAVVHIKSIQNAKIVQQSFNHPLDQLFKEFFGEGFRVKPREYKKPAREGSGSGVLYTHNGYIITNNHVIEGADSITVTLNDNRCYEAKIVGTDPAIDLAVLKIEETKLPYLKLGNSDTLEIGEWVLAVGNPFNLTSTVTKGIVSAKSRSLNGPEEGKVSIQSFIQTDAAINPGNSGGALVNLYGELIGINTAIYTSQTPTFVGYSFAIPSSLVKKAVSDIIQYGSVQRVLLGITISNINAELAKKLNLKKVSGVYIHTVDPKSPCIKLLQKEDVIIAINDHAINDHAINNMADLQEVIGCCNPGDKIAITLYRQGKEKVIEVVLPKQPDAVSIIEKQGAIQVEGAVFENIDAKTKEKLKRTEGVWIKEVAKGKFQAAGLKKGEILVSFDKQPIYNTSALAKMIRDIKGPALLGVVGTTGGPIRYLAVDFS